MKSIALISQKGGAGKSTLACQLSVAATMSDHRVALVDLDEQGSTADWGATRTAETPTIIRASWSDLGDVLANLADFDFVLVDTEGHASARTATILRGVDFALCPLRPSALDIATADRTAALVNAAGTPGMFVLNACGVRMREVAEARPILVALLPVYDTEIGERRAFSRSMQTGQSVAETDPGSTAANEIAALWTSIEERLVVNAGI